MNKSLFVVFICICFILGSNKTFAQVNKTINSRTDTLIFQASSYVIQPNDKLDDLLKRIPVVTIDNKGKIYVQGDTIQRVLVDGNEFFTDDPSVAAHVIRADKVEMIKIYYRWSDQASFTSIDDNVKFKTLNIIIKKEK